MSHRYRVRTKDTDGLEFDFVFTAAQFDALCCVVDSPGQIVEIAEHSGFVLNVLDRIALCLKPTVSRSWHFFDYDQFKQGASLVA